MKKELLELIEKYIKTLQTNINDITLNICEGQKIIAKYKKEQLLLMKLKAKIKGVL